MVTFDLHLLPDGSARVDVDGLTVCGPGRIDTVDTALTCSTSHGMSAGMYVMANGDTVKTTAASGTTATLATALPSGDVDNVLWEHTIDDATVVADLFDVSDGPGTISCTSTAMTCTEDHGLAVGDIVILNGNERDVDAVGSSTTVTLSSAFDEAVDGRTWTRLRVVNASQISVTAVGAGWGGAYSGVFPATDLEDIEAGKLYRLRTVATSGSSKWTVWGSVTATDS